MRASTQSVMYTLWSRSRVRTVSRSRLAWWPDSGATISTTGSFFIFSMVAGSSLKRLKRLSWQKDLASATRSITAISCPCASAAWMPNAGFS